MREPSATLLTVGKSSSDHLQAGMHMHAIDDGHTHASRSRVSIGILTGYKQADYNDYLSLEQFDFGVNKRMNVSNAVQSNAGMIYLKKSSHRRSMSVIRI